MRDHSFETFACAVLLILPAVNRAADVAPGSGDIRQARVASLANPSARCPDLHISDDENAVVVVFLVNTGGVPSKASVRASSGSPELDDAAMACVLRLRFQPATQTGDGTAFDSWQQMGWKWAKPSAHLGAAAGIGTVAAAASSAPESIAPVGISQSSAGAAATHTNAGDGAVQLHICADEKGRLTQDPAIVRSSGDPQVDAAAVKIAKSGSGAYRPAAQLNGKLLSGCADLAIKFETH